MATIPVLMLLQTLLAFLLAHVLAILAAAVRDTLQVLTFSLSVGIYLSPVLFTTTMFPAAWRWVLFANPMSALVLGYQAVLLKSDWPPLQVWGITLGWLLLLALCLNTLIRRSHDELVDWL